MAENGQHEESADPTGHYRVGDLRVDLLRGEVRRGGDVSSLGGQPLAILTALLESPCRSLGREELHTRLWPDEPFGDLDQRLNAAVRLLRRGLGDSSDEPRYVETLRGRGYRICASVERLDASGEPPGASTTPPGRSDLRGSPVLLVLGLLLLGVIVSGRFRAPEPEVESAPDPQEAGLASSTLGGADPGTSVGEAYGHYLSAMRFAGEQKLVAARQHLGQALDLDPDYLAAYVLLGRIHRAEGDFDLAENTFQQALDRDPRFADAHLGLAHARFWGLWNWQGAEESYLQARDLAPGRVEVHHGFAWYLLASRRFEEAAASMDRALELDPMAAVLHSDLGWFQYRMRNYPAALKLCQTALDLEPSLRSALDCRHRALARLGDYSEALAQALEVSEVPEEVRERLLSLPAIEGYRDFLVYVVETGAEGSPYVRAMNLAAAGRNDEALRQLELAVEGRDTLLVLIDVSPDLDPLLPDPRFQEVRRRIKGAE